MKPQMLLTLAGSQHGTPMQRAIFGYLPNANNFYLEDIEIDGSGQYIYTFNGVSNVVELEDDYSGSIYVPAADPGSKLIVRGESITTISHTTGHRLTTLDVSGLTELIALYCNNNSLTTLDVSGLTSLETLYCSYNSLTTLDVSGLTSLSDLDCNSNSLTTLNVSGLTSLAILCCNHNLLTTLDVSGLTSLSDLECDNNLLTTLDVSGLTSLSDLYCGTNSLTKLDVSGLTSLTTLYCNNNSLTTLDVSGLTSIGSLNCEYNSLIESVKFNATVQSISEIVASLITAATSTSGTVYLNSSDQYYSTVANAATTKGWTVASL